MKESSSGLEPDNALINEADSGGAVLPAQPAPRVSRLAHTFSSLRHRNYRLFFFGQLISLIGSWMQQTALQGLLYYSLGATEKQLGVIDSLRMLPMLLFTLYGGVVADRFSRHRIIIATQFTAMGLAFALSILVFSGSVAIWHVVVLGALMGLVMAFDIPARHAFVVEMVDREDLQNAIALNSSIFQAARMAGPAVAGILIAYAGFAACFFLNAVSYIAVLAGLFMMRLAPREPREKSVASAWAQVSEGFSIVWNNKLMRGLLVLEVVVGVFGISYAVLAPVFAKDVFGRGAGGLAILLSANGMGALVGALIVANTSEPKNRIKLIGIGTVLFSLMLFLFASSNDIAVLMTRLIRWNSEAGIIPIGAASAVQLQGLAMGLAFWLGAACLAGAGVGFLLLLSSANAYVQMIVPDNVRGRVMGVWAFSFLGALPAGSLQMGYLAQHLGAPNAVRIGSVMCAIAAIYVGIVLARNKQA